MSFDLAVWQSDEPLTNEQAGEVYLRLCEKWPYLEGNSSAVAAFYQDLTQHWPEIDTVPEEKIDDFDFCPWSCALNRSGRAVVMSCVGSKASQVKGFVEPLARKHGLLLFDPQANRVTLPERFRTQNRGLLHRLFARSK
jgi:hypothetical protein